MTRQVFLALSAGATLAMLVAGGPACAKDPDIAALEARVAELEALVQQLMQERKPATAARTEAVDPGASRSSFTYGGYIKLDSMFSDYGQGDAAPGSAGTQFYIPGAIPVGGGPGEGPDADIQARESRINFKSHHDLGNGNTVGTFLEVDFFLSPGGDERVSNSYNPRLRHAFVKYNGWLAGQTWSTFQDVAALPENLDFVGPSEGTTFVRQAQVRYKTGAWEFAVENPETTITPFGGGARIVSDDGPVPDLVARYTAKVDNGYVKAAALLRQLSYTTAAADDRETAFGISLSGRHAFGRDDLRWMATFGHGTGRYLGLNTANGAVIDANGGLEAIEQWGGFVSYRHFWNGSLRSNLTLGYLSNNHDTTLTGTGVTRDARSIHANLLYDPIPFMTVGAELMYAERTLETNESGDMTRLLLSAKYEF